MLLVRRGEVKHFADGRLARRKFCFDLLILQASIG